MRKARYADTTLQNPGFMGILRVVRKKFDDYCSLTPEFPEVLFSSVVTFSDESLDFSAIYPLDLVQSTPEAAGQYASMVIPKLESDNPGYLANQYLTVFPLYFSRLYDLNPVFWQHPDIDYGQTERSQLFVKIATLPQAYHMLVTPGYFKKGVWQFAAALPFFRTMEDKVLEEFMLRSNWPVERRAKYSAVYTIGEQIHINWVTGKIAATLPEQT